MDDRPELLALDFRNCAADSVVTTIQTIQLTNSVRMVIPVLTGIMNAPVYVDIIEQILLPFIQEVYPDSHRFVQDNDSKHTSKVDQTFLRTHKLHGGRLLQNHRTYGTNLKSWKKRS